MRPTAALRSCTLQQLCQTTTFLGLRWCDSLGGSRSLLNPMALEHAPCIASQAGHPPTIPNPAQAEHKISGSGPLVFELQKVPKLLGKLTSVWAPQAMVVSFKLETDEHVLLTKVSGHVYGWACAGSGWPCSLHRVL